jgi:alanine racemase
VGDEVVLLGSQGGEALTAETLADWMGSISYEVLCGVGARVPRVVTGEEA